MTQALRSPGSTLKPFIYGLGFEDGLLHPETLIDDKPARYGSYTPENFDLTFQGTVTVRRALQLSLNVPAIAVLDQVGVSRLSARLTQTGAALVLPKGEAPGLAMGLGGVGIKLSDLVMLYTGLARLGSALPLIEREGEAAPSPRRLLDPVAAWYVGNILIGAPPPDNAPPGRIAFKTGTSYGYRDAWAVGFDGRMTIGVWVGRPDGAPVPGLVGRAAAAPILFDAFARTGNAPAPLAHAPQGRGLRRHQQAAAAAATLQSRRRARAPRPSRRASCSRPTARASNSPRAARAEPVALKIAGGAAPLTVMVNGVPLRGARRPAHRVLRAGWPGLRAADGHGRPRRHRQRQRAPAISLARGFGMTALRLRALLSGPMRRIRPAEPARPMSTATNDARQSLRPARGLAARAGLCRRLAPARGGVADRRFR